MQAHSVFHFSLPSYLPVLALPFMFPLRPVFSVWPFFMPDFYVINVFKLSTNLMENTVPHR